MTILDFFLFILRRNKAKLMEQKEFMDLLRSNAKTFREVFDDLTKMAY